MYIPAPFRESDRATLYDFIVAHPLGVLVSAMADGHATAPYATHVPLHLDRERGVLTGHLARMNPHVQRLQPTGSTLVPGLVVFSGVDHYITPSWYATKQTTTKVVPTWNYVAVHVQGPVTLHDDVAWLATHLAALTDHHEASQAHPWAMHDAPADYLDAQMRAVVGVSIEIESLEGNYKLSQNSVDADIDGVVDGLTRGAHDPTAATMAQLMVARRPHR
ncbi:MAG: FMN-binding negative transcriptional regulator [Gemmatimonas sp.]